LRFDEIKPGMKAMSLTRSIALLGALITIAALALEYRLQFVSMPGVAPLAVTWRFLGYFTILTNMLVAAVWSAAALDPGARLANPVFEAMSFLMIAMVGLLYHGLLAGRWHPTGWQWLADVLVHTLIPIGFGLYWLLRPHGALRWRHAWVFALWPLFYCVYALMRGAFDGWYAYYFLDPDTTTWPQLLMNISLQAVAFVSASLLVIFADKALSGRFSRSPQPSASASPPWPKADARSQAEADGSSSRV
jgi:hypothetical protein